MTDFGFTNLVLKCRIHSIIRLFGSRSSRTLTPSRA